MSHRRYVAVALTTVALLFAVVTGSAATAPVTASGSTGPTTADVLVVDDDGDAAYRSIVTAAANASDGDTVRVRPGTYGGGIELAANVTVVAPQGATIAASAGPGTSRAEAAFVVEGSHAAPVVSGFTVVGFEQGFTAVDTTGDWVVSDTTFQDQHRAGIFAGQAAGDWVVRNVTIRNASNAIWAFRTGGGWRAENVTIRDSPSGVLAHDASGDWTVRDTLVWGPKYGIEATGTTGSWTLQNVTVDTDVPVDADDVDSDEALFTAVAARLSTGDWTIEDSTFRDGIVGVSAWQASGDWSVVDSRFVNLAASDRFRFMQPPLTEGAAVFAAGTNGSWTVRGTTVVNGTGPAIDATDAALAGEAVVNEFQTTGDTPVCVGNVRCGNGSTSQRPESTAKTSTATTTADADSSTAAEPTSAGTTTRSTAPTNGGTVTTTRASTPDSGPLTGSFPAWPLVAALVVVAGLVGLRVRRER